MGTQLMWKSSGRLADGREIIYFDERPGLGRATVPDTRVDLAAEREPRQQPATVSRQAALRWDPLHGEWVVVAAQRQERTFLPPPDQCPLCPSAPGRPTEIPASDYDVVVFENRFPSLRGAVPRSAAEPPPADWEGTDPSPGELVAQRPAVGRCEVVCFTADHTASFTTLTPRRVRTVLEAWVDRTAVLGAMTGVHEVYCFENRGEEIGVTLHHPHGQIYAFPFVTARTAQMVAQARRYAATRGRNLFDDVVAAEVAAGTRIVASNDGWIAFVPEFARWPFEVLLFPTRRVPDLTALDEAARGTFGDLYLDVLRRFDGLFGKPAPYIAAWRQAPTAAAPTDREGFALHLQIFSIRRAADKLKYLAGAESGAGVWINDIAPECAARRLREVET